MFELAAIADLQSVFTLQSLYVIASLVVIEGLLSVDNALAIAAMASHLEPKQRKLAMTIGYIGAYGFRIVALLIASYIINNHVLMYMGAIYLIWLMCDHFVEEEEEENEHGDKPKVYDSFARTVTMIAALDLSLSLDNVVAAVAFARDNIWLVYLGVTIGIITLRFVAGYCIKLLDVHPWLEHTAFLLVGFVGFLLLAELFWDQRIQQELKLGGLTLIHGEDGHFHIVKGVKFGGIFLIIASHLIFEKVAGVKSVVGPILKPVRHLFAMVGRTVSFVFGLLTWPIRKLFSSLAKKPE